MMDMNTGSRHNRAALVAGAMVVVSLLAACDLTGIAGSGPVTSETRSAQAFSRVEVGNGIEVTVQIAQTPSINVQAQENLLKLIETRVDGQTLRIGATSQFHSSPMPRVTLTTPTLDSIALSGGSQGRVDGLANQAFRVELNGGAALTASGTTRDLTVDASGGATAALKDLRAGVATLEVSGGATTQVNASDEVRGDVSGGGQAIVAGTGRLNVTSSAGGEVRHE